MPKQFGHHTRCTLVIASLLALNLVGCRTATTRLASIPGMGWIDRGENSFGEGWADYEPAPELPPPSATSEPSSTSSTSGLASNSEGSHSRQGYGSYSDMAANTDPGGLNQFSDSSADVGNNRYNSGSTYGNDALGATGSSYGASGSSYGASGPSLDENDRNSYAPQQGFYGSDTVPNYASSTPSSYSNYGRYGNSGSSAANTGASVSGYGDYAASGGGNRYGSPDTTPPTNSSSIPTYGGSPGTAAAYTADRNSRFDGSRFDGSTTHTGAWGSDTGSVNASGQNSTSTYTPPGFPSSSYSTATSPASNIGSANRFDSYQSAVQAGAAQAGALQAGAAQARPPLGVAQDSMGTTSSPPGSAGGGVVNNYAASPGGSMGTNQTQSGIGGAPAAFGGYGTATHQSINRVPGGNTQIDNVGPFSGGNRFGSAAQTISPSAQPGLPSGTSTTIDSPTSNAGRYADAWMQSTPNQLNGTGRGGAPDAANGYIQAAQDGFAPSREVDYGNASPDAEYRGTERYGAPIPQYPSTSTPHDYLTPSTSAPTTTPGTPPSSSIRRSPTPWRPGSTSDFQGSNVTGPGSTIQTSYRPSLSTSIVMSEVHDDLVLAVGDKFQYPRLLR